jgi:crossover junction endodeoxyribonuclease RuvC
MKIKRFGDRFGEICAIHASDQPPYRSNPKISIARSKPDRRSAHRSGNFLDRTLAREPSRNAMNLAYTRFMPNHHPPLTNLRPQTPKWSHQPTIALRVPEIFREEIAEFARKLDNGEATSPEPPTKMLQPPSPAVWLGIKPSISQSGWAVLEGDPDRPEPVLVDYGTIVTPPEDPLPKRLAEIESDLSTLLEEFHPGHVAIETPFINSEYPSGRKTLQAIGVINAAIYRVCRLSPIALHTTTWKSHLDSPKAERADIAAILESLFDLKHLPANAAVDATAIAYAAWCGVGGL